MKALVKRQEPGQLVSTRQLIKEMYLALGQKVFGFSPQKLKWMANYIDKSMTEIDIRREWGFIKSGNAKMLGEMLLQMEISPDQFSEDQHLGVQDLWLSLAKGLDKYKSQGLEIPREDYKFMHDAIVQMAKQLKSGPAKLPGKSPKRLIGAKFLTKVQAKYHMVTARNLVNVEDLDKWLKGTFARKIEGIGPLKEKVLKWTVTTLKKYIVNDYPGIQSFRGQIPEDGPDWLKKAKDRGTELFIFKPSTQLKDQVDHIIDYLESLGKVPAITVPEAIKASELWSNQIEKVSGRDTKADIDFVTNLADGFYVVRIKSAEGLTREGKLMGHCLKDPQHNWFEKVQKGLTILSLRDKHGNPHATFEVNGGQIDQMKGKQNKEVDSKYHKYLHEFLQKYGALKK